jgi:hypothetical protein
MMRAMLSRFADRPLAVAEFTLPRCGERETRLQRIEVGAADLAATRAPRRRGLVA